MKKFEKLQKFQEALKRGKLGKVESFELWLKTHGFDPNKTNYEYVHKYYLKNPLELVNYEKELEIIAEFIGFYLRDRSDIYHLPLLGVHGSGKTLLLNAVNSMLRISNEGVKVGKYDAALFSEIANEGEQYIFTVIDEITEDIDVVILDSCDRDRLIDYSLRKISEKAGSCVYITSWSPEKWRYICNKVEEFLQTSKEIYIEPFEKEETVELLKNLVTIMHYESETIELGIQKSVYESVHDFSRGIPGISVKLFLNALKETFLKQKEAVDKESVESAAKRMGLFGISEKLNELSELHLQILRLILLSYDERGIRPSELVETIGKDKATISYHLQTLRSEGFLEVERAGRSSFYKIKENIKPLIQLKISEEVEYG